MEAYMDMTKKTTILFSPEMHRRLTELAARRGRSLGELVREACEVQYGVLGGRDQEAAVAELAGLALPVDTPGIMKRESVPHPDDLLP
jgi:predicted transcriptional regulator